jgi:hypothetical protein
MGITDGRIRVYDRSIRSQGVIEELLPRVLRCREAIAKAINDGKERSGE